MAYIFFEKTSLPNDLLPACKILIERLVKEWKYPLKYIKHFSKFLEYYFSVIIQSYLELIIVYILSVFHWPFLSPIFPPIFKVWSMLHHGSVGQVQSKECYFKFTYTFFRVFPTDRRMGRMERRSPALVKSLLILPH